MTQAELRTAVRNIIEEQSTDAGALMPSNTILDDYMADAVEQLVLDLLPTMPEQFCATEDVNLVANDADYSLTNEFWMIYKVEKNVSGQDPVPIDIIKPLMKQAYMYVGETGAEPRGVYFLGQTMYVVPTPSAAATGYLRVYYVRPEATSMAAGGPVYIPRAFHRAIVYYTASLVATMLGVSSETFLNLYRNRVNSGIKVWNARYQQRPKFVNPAYAEQVEQDTRERAFYDKNWK